jgi:hypothetical protein
MIYLNMNLYRLTCIQILEVSLQVAKRLESNSKQLAS